MKQFSFAILATILLLIAPISSKQQNFLEKNEQKQLKEDKFKIVKEITQQYENNQTFPGSQISAFDKNSIIYTQMSGHLTFPNDKFDTPVEESTLYDMASVTKVMSTTSAIMVLYEQGLIKIDDHMVQYLPEANNHQKGFITIRNLLLHNAGLYPDYEPFPEIKQLNKEEFLDWLMNCSLMYPIGQKSVYSDLSMVFLQLIVERVSGMNLSDFVQKYVFSKLGMERTFYQPSVAYQSQGYCAPTELDMEWRVMLMRCIVHDPTAYVMEGISGNAGLFSYYKDATVFMQMMLNEGEYNGIRIFKPMTVKIFTTREEGLPYHNTRALGWDTCGSGVPQSCGQHVSQNSFGHTGYTGTALWGDKDKGLGVAIITNRVYPDDSHSSKVGISWFRNNVMNELMSIMEEEQQQTQLE